MTEKMIWAQNNGATFRDVFDVNNPLDFHNAKTQIIELFMNRTSSIGFLDIKEHTGFSKRMIISVCEELRRDGLVKQAGRCKKSSNY